ncbi:uncharacterized protein BX663DRAFT_451842, partial [Cokeromyces recurvatus]|uniref:uncharacterized protein n=1 Tax=Cokeromyces recurvatus TaxID=90255 RepID=UPI00221E6292
MIYVLRCFIQSRRWNRAIRNLLHKQVFMNDSYLLKTTPPDSSITVTKDKSIDYLKTPLVVVVLQQRIMSFFTRTRQGRGLLAFIISGIFHELIIMSTCRRMTFENLLFFILQGLFVLLEVE